MLGWVLRAATQAAGIDAVIVATSTEQADDAVEEEALSLGVPVVRGSESDVLSRFVLAADEHPCDAIVRLTADCPLLDPSLISQTVALWRADPAADYVATTLVRSLPRGLDVELATVDALRRADRTVTGYHRTHVTSGLYAHPDEYRLSGLVVRPAADDLRVTLDTPADVAVIEAVAAELGDRPPSWRYVVALLRRRPDLVAMNAQVRQKSIEEG